MESVPYVAANNDKALSKPSDHVSQKIRQQILGTQFLPEKKHGPVPVEELEIVWKEDMVMNKHE